MIAQNVLGPRADVDLGGGIVDGKSGSFGSLATAAEAAAHINVDVARIQHMRQSCGPDEAEIAASISIEGDVGGRGVKFGLPAWIESIAAEDAEGSDAAAIVVAIFGVGAASGKGKAKAKLMVERPRRR